VLDDKYLKTAGGRESDDYRNFKEDTFMNILHLLTFKKPKRYKNLGSTKRGLGMNSFLIFVL
jgi:hypothetical protein